MIHADIRNEVELFVDNDTMLAPLWCDIQQGLLDAAKDTGVLQFHWSKCSHTLFEDKGISTQQDINPQFLPLFTLCRLYHIRIMHYYPDIQSTVGNVIRRPNTTDYIVSYVYPE